MKSNLILGQEDLYEPGCIRRGEKLTGGFRASCDSKCHTYESLQVNLSGPHSVTLYVDRKTRRRDTPTEEKPVTRRHKRPPCSK